MARCAVLSVLVFFCVAAAAGPASSQSELVVARDGDKDYHWPSCEQIKDAKDVLALTRAQATARGLKPHDGCDPAKAAGSGNPSAPSPAPDPSVYVDSGRYYHKKGCTKLGKEARKLKLDEAGRKYWPCPTCKPPIRKRKRAEDWSVAGDRSAGPPQRGSSNPTTTSAAARQPHAENLSTDVAIAVLAPAAPSPGARL